MTERTIFITLIQDLVSYPPVLSIIYYLLDLNYKIIYIGSYSDTIQKQELKTKGVEFIDLPIYDIKKNFIVKYRTILTYKNTVKKILKKRFNKERDLLWIMNNDSIYILGNTIVKQYPTILHFYESISTKMYWKFRFISPSFNIAEICQKAYKVICCEYNRAHITKGMCNMNELPIVLPNKSYDEKELSHNIPSDIKNIYEDICNKVLNRTIILYQGIFNSKERRLEEFINAVMLMNDDVKLLIMGNGNDYFHSLKAKYNSEKIVFIDFIRPPFHLLVTKLAHIGILSYFPHYSGEIADVLNPLYCAPNKIFEYSRFSIPMISNDIPALNSIFKEYKCGEVIGYPIDKNRIKNKIEQILSNYNDYSKGAIMYYNSINTKDIIKNIVQ